MSATAAFVWLVAATGMGFVLSALGAAVVLLLREPARRVRAIELTLLACLVAPWLPAVPGLPRVAWREWLAAAPEVAGNEVRDAAPALEPAVPTDVLDAPEPTERASAPPIIELAVVPEPSDTPLRDLPVAHEPMSPAEPEVLAPIEQAEVPAVAATAAEPVAPSPPSPAVELPAARQVDWQAVVVSLYLAGVAATILLDALGGLALLRVWKTSRDAEPRVQALLSEVAGQSVGRVSLLVSPRCWQPFTFAWLWPVIVLPPALVAPGKERELRWAIAHEWSHVANRHTWGWALAGLARAIYWPQPLVWLLRRRLRLEQDFLADAQAAGRASEAPDYATFLTTQAATAHGLTPGLGIAGGKSELARRVVMLVQGKLPVARCGWGWSLGFAIVMTACVVLATSISQQPSIAAAEDPKTPNLAEEVSQEQLADPPREAAKAEDDKAAEEGPPATAGNGEHVIEPLDLLTIEAVGVPSFAQPSEQSSDERAFSGFVNRDGEVLLSARFGSVAVAGLSIAEAETKVLERLKAVLQEDVQAGRMRNSNFPVVVQIKPAGRARSLMLVQTPSRKEQRLGAGNEVRVTTNGVSMPRPPEGRFVVEPQGTLALGPRLGRVEVKGLSPEQAGERILERIRDAVPKFDHLPDLVRANAKVSVTFVDDEQSVPETEYVPLPTPGQRITPGNTVGIEALGPNLELKLLGVGSVDSAGRLSLRRTGDRYLRRSGDSLWVVGIDSDLQAAGLTEKELESAVRRELEKTGPVSWLAVRLGGYDTREPGWVASAPDQPSKGGTAARRIASLGGSKPNLRYAGKSFDQWNEELQNDLDPETRIQAIAALGQFGANGLTDQAIAALVPLLGSETATPDGKQVGRVAAETLASFGQAVVPALIETLQGADEKARLGAARALSRLGDAAAPAAESLVAAAAASERKYDFVSAIAAIHTRPEITLPYLKEAALSDSGHVRWESLHGLGALKLTDDQIVPLIIESLETWPPAHAPMIESIVREMIKRNSPARSVAVLRQLLKGAKGKDLQQRAALIQAAKELGPAAAPLIPDVIEVIKATSPQEQQQEVQLLHQVLLAMGPSAKDALPALRQWRDELGDEPLERFVAQQIERIIDDVLRSLGEAPVTPTGRRGRAAPRQSSEQEAAASRQYAGKSFAQWRAVLDRDLDPATRVEAIKALGKFGANGLAKEAAEAIVPFIGFRDGDENVVYATAFEEMVKLGQPAVAVVAVALASPDAKLREGAGHVFMRMPADEQALAALVKALDDQVPSVRIAAAGALGVHRHELDRAGIALEQAAESDDSVTRDAVARQLLYYFPPSPLRLKIVNEFLDRSQPRTETLFGPGLPMNAEFVVPLMQERLELAIADLQRVPLNDHRRRGMREVNDLNVRFVRPLLALSYAGPKAAPALPTVLKLAERPDLLPHIENYMLTVLRAIGPAAAPTARPVLERLREDQQRGNTRVEIDELLRSWGEAPAEPTGGPKGEEPSKTTDKPAAVRREYAGKSFAEWQAVLEKDLDPATRIEAIVAIGEFGASGQAEDAIGVLIPLLGSQARSDKQWVATAAQQALSKIGAPAVPALIERLKNGDSASQLKAIDAFADMGEAAAPAADALLDLARAKASEPDWQLPLVRAIARIQSRPEATLPFLKAMVSSHNQDVRVEAIHGLSGLKTADEDVVPVIVESIWSYSVGQGRSNFFQRLPIGGGRTVPVMRGLLELAKKDVASSDGMVAVLFMRAGEMGPAAAPLVPLMIEVSQHDPNWRGAAIYFVQAVDRIGPGAKEALPYLRGMRDGQTDPGLRKLVNSAIKAIEGSP